MELQKYAKGEALGEMDIKTAQRVLWLSDFFKIADLESHSIKQYIIPKLSKDNVLIFLEDSYAKISCLAPSEENDELGETWNLLLTECLDLTANNLPFLIRAQKEAILKLEDVIAEELAERAFKLFSVQLSTDGSYIIDLLLEKKHRKTPFELLDIETAKVAAKEKVTFTNGRTAPTLTWNLSNLKENFYRESEAFFVLGCYWVLSIWSFKKEGILSIAIKHSKNPRELDEPSSSSYYNKNKFFVNPSKKRIPSPRNTESKGSHEILEGKVPNHCILTLASCIRIKELEDPGKGGFSVVSLLTASKSPTLLRKIPISDIPETGGKLSIEIFIKLEHTHSGILTFISSNFDWLYHSPDISKLTKNQFVVLLKHKHLNVKREEDALVALCIWLSAERDKSEYTGDEMKELLENINWEYVSMYSLVDLTNNFPLLKTNKVFKKILSNEINRRLEGRENQLLPRRSYKYQTSEESTQPFVVTLTNAFLEQRDELSTIIKEHNNG